MRAAPGLGNQRAAGAAFGGFAGGDDERADQRVVGAVFDAQVRLGFGQGDRLFGRDGEAGEAHALLVCGGVGVVGVAVGLFRRLCRRLHRFLRRFGFGVFGRVADGLGALRDGVGDGVFVFVDSALVGEVVGDSGFKLDHLVGLVGEAVEHDGGEDAGGDEDGFLGHGGGLRCE